MVKGTRLNQLTTCQSLVTFLWNMQVLKQSNLSVVRYDQSHSHLAMNLNVFQNGDKLIFLRNREVKDGELNDVISLDCML